MSPIDDGPENAPIADLEVKWIRVAEIITPEGNRGIFLDASEGIHDWEVLGMLEYAMIYQRANIAKEAD